MIVLVCREAGCRVQLSRYNPTSWCWEHRRATRRIEEELAGAHVLSDDEWLRSVQRDREVETWRPHIMSDTFVKGLERRELRPRDRKAYESGAWLGGGD